MAAALLAHVFAEKLMRFGIQNANVQCIPLHLDCLSDPTRRDAVEGPLHFEAAVKMNDTTAVLVIAEWFNRQRKQRRLLFDEHRRNLSLRCAVDARIGPAGFPLIQIRLSLLETLKPLSLEWCFLSVGHGGLHFPFAIGILNPAWHCHDAVMR